MNLKAESTGKKKIYNVLSFKSKCGINVSGYHNEIQESLNSETLSYKMAEQWGEHNFVTIVSIIIEHLLYTSYYSRYLAHHSIIPVIFTDEKNQRSKIFSNLFNISQLIKGRFIKSHQIHINFIPLSNMQCLDKRIHIIQITYQNLVILY